MPFNDVDQINDYSLGEGDTLDISDLLSGFVDGTSDINDFVQFYKIQEAMFLSQVDADGAANGANFQSIAQIYWPE